jgi:hypothetical protein
MFSMTLCLDSTSQADTTTEAMAPDGNSHEFNEPLGVKADGVNETK